MEKDYKGNFIVHSDSLRVTYSFHGENAPVKINIFNKMNRNVIIDWESSWFSFGDSIDNRINLGTYMDESDKMSLVAPYSNKETELFELSNLKFDELNKDRFASQAVVLMNGRTEKLKVAEFNNETTPLYMRSFLSLHLGHVSDSPMIYEQDFYIKSITNAGELKPEEVAMAATNQGDIFYTRKEHGKGLKQALSIGGQVLIITGAVAVDVILSASED